MRKYDVVIIGTGFASTFFLKRMLRSSIISKILVLERGELYPYAWQVENLRHNELEQQKLHREDGLPDKSWTYNIGFGGGSNCWWTNAMRIHPADFELQSRYGVGVDWPLKYEDLESYYCDAEDDMIVSGDNSSETLFPRSRPFPQLRHRYSGVGSALKSAYPDHTFAMPTTRARTPTEKRGACCAIGRCWFCPNHAKFTIVEEMQHLFDDPRVTLVTGAEALNIETSGGLASGVNFRHEGKAEYVGADFIALGTNGIFNPFLLLKSGITDGPVGEGLIEQIPINLEIDFEAAKNEGFSSFTGAVNYSFSDGPQRAQASGGFLEVNSSFKVRPHKEKWNNRADAVFLLGDLRQSKNKVTIDPDDPNRPLAIFEDWSPYAYAGLEHVKSHLTSFLEPLGVEHVEAAYGHVGSHAHIEGTTVMGDDPEQSVIDKNLIHHRIRNLAVLGSGAFPTSPGSNPTLTIAALSLRAADKAILGR